MIYILRITHQLEADKWYFLWTNGIADSIIETTRAEAEGLLLCGVFRKDLFTPEQVEGWVFRKNGHMIKISAVTYQLDSNTWAASWTNSGTRGDFKIIQVEADQLTLSNSFTRGEGNNVERWFFKQVTLPARTPGNISQAIN